MSDNEVGHEKPSRRSRSQNGARSPASRKGDRKRPVDQLIFDFVNSKMTYSEDGKTRTATRVELALRSLVIKAAKGSTASAKMLLKLRPPAKHSSDDGTTIISLINSLPDEEWDGSTTVRFSPTKPPEPRDPSED